MPQVTAEELLRTAAAAKEKVQQDPSDEISIVMQAWTEYLYSMHILEENTLENAKRLGYLDARELYPDVEVPAIEGFVKAHLENPDGVYAEL